MISYVAFLRGVNVAGKWVKMEDVRKRLMSAGYENVKTYIQSGNVFFDSKDKDELKVQAKISRLMTELAGSEVHVAVFPRVRLHVLVNANPFAKRPPTKQEEKLSVIFLVREPKRADVPLFSTQKDTEVFYYKDRIALGVSRKVNGKFTYPTALIETKWSVPATTRFWHTFENMLNEMS